MDSLNRNMLLRKASNLMLRTGSQKTVLSNAGSPQSSQTRPEASSSECSTLLDDRQWKIDQTVIDKGLTLLPHSLSSTDKFDFLGRIAVEKPNDEWVDFDYCQYTIGKMFKVFSERSRIDDIKWVFWTENALNAKLTNLVFQLELQRRTYPEYQLRCIETSKPILDGSVTEKKSVIAIDFGSTHSGYAYALTLPPQTVHIERIKGFGTSSLQPLHREDKQPTCALFDKNLKLISYGNDARDWFMRSLAGDLLLNKFTQSGDNRFAQDYLYFDGDLKMRLWAKDRTGAPKSLEELEARTCKTLGGTGGAPLIAIVAKILEYIKNEALEVVNEAYAEAMSQVDPESKMEEKRDKITARDVLWVLTVPAIWRESDKQFMRKAAFDAGIIEELSSSDLILALEPECAALAAKFSSNRINLNPGEKLLTFDCGGGTVDVCAIEVLSNENKFTCKQLLVPTGGDWGGKKIDDAFFSFFTTLFGSQILERCSLVNPAAMIELMEQWEKLKTSLTMQDFLHAIHSTPLTVDVDQDRQADGEPSVFETNQEPPLSPISTLSGQTPLAKRKMSRGSTLSPQLATKVQRAIGSLSFVNSNSATHRYKSLDVSHVLIEAPIKESLSQLCKRFNSTMKDPSMHVSCKSETLMSTTRTILRMPMKLILSFFEPTLDQIVQHCRNLRLRYAAELSRLNQVLLVGGVGTCPLLKFKFEREFPNLNILTSPRSSALVEYGAVKFGLQPGVFQSRRAKLTLGIKSTVEYRPQVHRGPLYRENKYFDRNQKRHFIRNMFKPFLIAGEEVEQEKIVTHKFQAPNKDSEMVKFDIFTCDDGPPVEFITEEGCRLLARILVPVTKGEMTPLEVRIKIGFTEISAEVSDLNTNKVVVKRVLFEFGPSKLDILEGLHDDLEEGMVHDPSEELSESKE